MTNGKGADPGAVMQALNAFWVTGALKGALELDLFTHVGKGHDSVPALAKASGATERGVRAIADAMCALGFLRKEAGRYALTEVADGFLRSDRPTFVGGFHAFLTDPLFWEAYNRVADSARSGRSVFDENALDPQNPMWVRFARSSLPMAMGSAMRLPPLVDAGRPGLRILDVAAGSGGYGITLAQASQGSKLTFLDWPNVLEVSTENARRMGLEGRVSTIPGSALEQDWGGPYDVVVAANFFHHFGPSACVEIARRAKAALAPGGAFATCEFVPDEDRKESVMPLLFSVTMLVWTDEGDAYRFSELERFLHGGGFSSVKHHVEEGNPSSWVVAR